MESIIGGDIRKVYYAHLSPDEDLYDAIKRLAEEKNIHTGLVLTITGALANTRLSMPLEADDIAAPPKVFELAGTAEATGTGYFGRALRSWSSDSSGVSYVEGEPFLHVHMSASIAGTTYCGHLIDGCRVRSLHPSSHFVIAVAEVDGVRLTFDSADETLPGYPSGIPFYKLESA